MESLCVRFSRVKNTFPLSSTSFPSIFSFRRIESPSSILSSVEPTYQRRFLPYVFLCSLHFLLPFPRKEKQIYLILLSLYTRTMPRKVNAIKKEKSLLESQCACWVTRSSKCKRVIAKKTPLLTAQKEEEKN